MTNHSNLNDVTLSGVEGHYDYEAMLQRLQKRGVEQYGQKFKLHPDDKDLLCKLLCYFLKDTSVASRLGINLEKGILLTGPIGVGKTTLMNLLRFCEPAQNRFIIKSCRDISFEFIEHGYSTIPKYSTLSFKNHNPVIYCFDDLGTENSLKFYGNECNIMAEIILSRYDQFVSRKLITHITTNLSASEIENIYGNRVRSRMRELFNLIAFNRTSEDKRK